MDADRKYPTLANANFLASMNNIAPKILQKLKLMRSEPIVTDLLKKYLNGNIKTFFFLHKTCNLFLDLFRC